MRFDVRVTELPYRCIEPPLVVHGKVLGICTGGLASIIHDRHIVGKESSEGVKTVVWPMDSRLAQRLDQPAGRPALVAADFDRRARHLDREQQIGESDQFRRLTSSSSRPRPIFVITSIR